MHFALMCPPYVESAGHRWAIDPDIHVYLLMMRDVTDQRLVEAQRESKLQRLQRVDLRTDEFLAIAAHELRNPLGVLLNGVQMMSRNADCDAHQRRALEIRYR